MPGLLGKKIGMTSVFSADGKRHPFSVLMVRMYHALLSKLVLV